MFDKLGGENEAVNKLKSTREWSTQNGNNESGFNAFPAGDLNSDGMDFSKTQTVFWTSSSADGTIDKYGNPNYGHFYISIRNAINIYHSQSSNFSVRCIKDKKRQNKPCDTNTAD